MANTTGKKYFKGLDVMQAGAHEVTKLPRTCVMPVIRDPATGVYNASPYSAGIVSLNPFRLAIGMMSPASQQRMKSVETFTLGVPSIEQTDQVWVAAMQVPDGISELDLLDWHLFRCEGMQDPGIQECRLNMQCKRIELIKLPEPWRTVVIVEVTGICIDRDLLEMCRSDALKLLPAHEGGMRISDALYGLSTMSGGISQPEAAPCVYDGRDEDGRIFIKKEAFYDDKNKAILANGLFPRPCYIVMVNDEQGHPMAETVSLGHLQSSEPALHVPLPKSGKVYQRIRETGKFNICLPAVESATLVERLRQSPGSDPFDIGFTYAEPNMFGIPCLKECPIHMDADVCAVREAEDAGYGLIIAAKVGIVLDGDIAEKTDQSVTHPRQAMECINNVYSRLIYLAFDLDMRETQVRYGKDSPVPFRTAPSWGNRLTGGWHEVNGFHYWLLELVRLSILSKRELTKIQNELRFWNNAKGIEYLRSYYPEGVMETMRERPTKLLRMMAWAHHDRWKWDRVHQFLEEFPDPDIYRGHHIGPMYMPNWDIEQMF